MKKLTTIADVEIAMNQLLTRRSEIDELSAETNEAIAAERSKLVPKVSALEEEATRIEHAIEAWANEHREDEELFGEKKSLELRSGTIAFRLGAESLTLRKGFSTDDVVERLKEEGIKNGIKQADPTLDKSAIKKLVDQGKIDEKTLKALGLEITQSESFTLTLKTVDAYKE